MLRKKSLEIRALLLAALTSSLAAACSDNGVAVADMDSAGGASASDGMAGGDSASGATTSTSGGSAASGGTNGAGSGGSPADGGPPDTPSDVNDFCAADIPISGGVNDRLNDVAGCGGVYYQEVYSTHVRGDLQISEEQQLRVELELASPITSETRGAVETTRVTVILLTPSDDSLTETVWEAGEGVCTLDVRDTLAEGRWFFATGACTEAIPPDEENTMAPVRLGDFWINGKFATN